jgi:hypothetical protein
MFKRISWLGIRDVKPFIEFCLWAGALVVARPMIAQLPGGGQAGWNAATLKLFSDVPAFTSKTEIRLQQKGSTEPLTMVVDFALLDGKVRLDLDLNTIKSKQLPAETMASFKAAGLDKLATVVRPDRKSALLIYPGVRGYVEMPMPPEEAAEVDRKFKLEKTRLGRETVDGHSCEKNKVVISADTGGKHEAIVWYAADLNNFPLRVQMIHEGATVVMDYRNVKFVRTDPKQFDPPAGYTKHATAELLMQNAMMKMLGGKR